MNGPYSMQTSLGMSAITSVVAAVLFNQPHRLTPILPLTVGSALQRFYADVLKNGAVLRMEMMRCHRIAVYFDLRDAPNASEPGAVVATINGYVASQQKSVSQLEIGYDLLLGQLLWAQWRNGLVNTPIRIDTPHCPFCNAVPTPDDKHHHPECPSSESGDATKMFDWRRGYDIGHRDWRLETGSRSFTLGLSIGEFHRRAEIACGQIKV